MTARHRTSTDHVNATVIGLSKGATNNSAVSEPKRGPRTPRSPITIGIVVREQPGINAPAAIATGNPVPPKRASGPAFRHQRAHYGGGGDPDREPRQHADAQRAEARQTLPELVHGLTPVRRPVCAHE